MRQDKSPEDLSSCCSVTHCRTIYHHGYLWIKHTIWGKRAALTSQLGQHLLKIGGDCFLLFLKPYATELSRRKQSSFPGCRPSKAKLFKAYYLHKCNEEGTALQNCANDWFYATSVQQGEFIIKGCEPPAMKSSSSAWVRYKPTIKNSTDRGNQQQELTIPSDGKRHDNEAAFIQRFQRQLFLKNKTDPSTHSFLCLVGCPGLSQNSSNSKQDTGLCKTSQIRTAKHF